MEKELAVYKLKSITTHGNKCVHYFKVFDNGTVGINQFVWSKETLLDGYDVVFSRFGKTMHRKTIGFKYGTIAAIFSKLDETLVKNNIKEIDILL